MEKRFLRWKNPGAAPLSSLPLLPVEEFRRVLVEAVRKDDWNLASFFAVPERDGGSFRLIAVLTEAADGWISLTSARVTDRYDAITPECAQFQRFEREIYEQTGVLPEGHPLAEYRKIPVSALCEEPFMLLEKGAKAEVSEIFERSHLTPKVHFTTWDDYAIMAMVEGGLGISVLPELILKRIPYRIVARELEIPAYRNIGLAMRSRKTAQPAVQRFLEYLQYRQVEKTEKINYNL